MFRAGPLTRPGLPPAGGFGGRFRRPCTDWFLKNTLGSKFSVSELAWNGRRESILSLVSGCEFGFPFRDFGTENFPVNLKLFNLLLILSLCFYKYLPQNNLHCCLQIFRFPGNLCRDPRKFFYINKGFSGTDIHHFDIKKCVTANLNFF